MKSFISEPGNGERYARDKHGNEIYPNRKQNIFARNKYYKEYYARDAEGNEFYPVMDGRCILIHNDEGGTQLAILADGTQRYPKDKRGNEYYLRHEVKPYLLRQQDGQRYLAKNRRGSQLIPWNHLLDYAQDETKYSYCKDSEGNGVYIHKSELPTSMKLACNCICRLAVAHPGAFPCCLRML